MKSFVFIFYGAIILISIVILVYLIAKRLNEKEDFEQRDN